MLEVSQYALTQRDLEDVPKSVRYLVVEGIDLSSISNIDWIRSQLGDDNTGFNTHQKHQVLPLLHRIKCGSLSSEAWISREQFFRKLLRIAEAGY